MSESSGIRWTTSTWNPMSGCTQVSPGCANCYAMELAERMRGTVAFPVGFDPVWKPHKLRDPYRWKDARRIFVNSMSDVFHEAFSDDMIDQVFQVMLDVPRHTYQVLTKRPERMADYTLGLLDRAGLDALPSHIWMGTSIENDRWVTRADHLRRIPVPVRFLSCEPLLAPLPSLDLTGIGWVIVGGESGPRFRPMDPQWAADIRDACLAGAVPFFYKQSAARHTEQGQLLFGERWEQYPVPDGDSTPGTLGL